MACNTFRQKENKMSELYIRVKKDGFIYPYDPILAENPACEVVSEDIAYPERFVPEPAKKRKRPIQLDLFTDDIPEAPEYTPPELAAEASRGLP
jgi:hypothetical protein